MYLRFQGLSWRQKYNYFLCANEQLKADNLTPPGSETKNIIFVDAFSQPMRTSSRNNKKRARKQNEACKRKN